MNHYLVLNDSYAPEFLLLKACLTQSELPKFLEEVASYSDRLEQLDKGTAPVECYVDVNDRNNRAVAKNSSLVNVYPDARPGRGDYEALGIWLTVIREDGNMIYGGDDELTPEELETITSQTVSVYETVGFITEKYDPYDCVSLGHELLPLTKKFLEC